MNEITELRYAHGEGFTNVCFDDLGNRIVTAGADGDLRIWEDFDDPDAKSLEVGNFVSALDLKGDVVYLAGDSCAVSAYSFPALDFEAVVAQFSTAVYCIACNGRHVAAGGGDFVIKVYGVSDKSLVELQGHEGPVLSLALDPLGECLASSGCDGTVKIWLLSSQKCSKTLKLFKKSNDLSTSSTLCRMDWSSDGKLLAIPVEKAVRLYARESFDLVSVLVAGCIEQDLSLAAFSPYGTFVAAAALDGRLLVWDVLKKECVSKKLHSHTITCLKWNPSGTSIVFADAEGYMGLDSSPLPEMASTTDAEENLPSLDEEFNEDDEPANILDMEATEEKDKAEMDEDSGSAFDIGAIKASMESQIFGAEEEPAVVPVEEPVQAPVVFKPPPVQTSFQPTSTPTNLERRFMVWNEVGVVRCYNTEEESSIDVEFHDAQTHHPMHLANPSGHTLGALSPSALLLASPSTESQPSQLECTHFGSWDLTKEWSMRMPDNEDIEVVGVSDTFAACVTDRLVVRIFSLSGVQSEALLVPGPPVACTAHNDRLLIAHHRAQGVEGSQSLGLTVVTVRLGGHSSTQEYSVPLAPKSFLTWLGFSDEGSPCIVDTSGTISLLNLSCGAKWTPVANTTAHVKGKSDTCFVVGLSELRQEVRYILCKGSRYPGLLPKPTVSVLPFSLPFCSTLSEEGRLEEENARCVLAVGCAERLASEGFEADEAADFEKKWAAVLMKMFALSTRRGLQARALEVGGMMRGATLVQAAIKYASRTQHLTLADRLGRMLAERTTEEAQGSQHEESLQQQPSFSNNNSQYEESLQPKPLSRRSLLETTRDQEEEEEEITAEPIPNQSTPVAVAKPNPFKSASKPLSRREEQMDSLLNSSMQSRVQVVESKPPSRFGPRKESGLALYLAQNRAEVEAEAPSGASEAELLKVAMRLFKALPKTEKMKYAKDPNCEKPSDVKENRLSTPPVKRKEEDVDAEPPKKQQKTSQPTTLSRFAFTKTPK